MSEAYGVMVCAERKSRYPIGFVAYLRQKNSAVYHESVPREKSLP
jgi:hypothetical protein